MARHPVFLLMFLFWGIPMVTRAQVAVRTDSIELSKAISLIQEHYNADIFFKAEWLDGLKTIMPPGYHNLDQDLDFILNGLPFSYYDYRSKYIILYRDSNVPGSKFNGRNSASVYSNIIYRLDGRILAENSEEPVIGATIYINELDTGAITNLNGFFKFSLPGGPYSLTIKSVGFIDQTEKIDLQDNITVNYYLPTEVRQLNEVVISGQAEDNVTESTMGISKINIRSLIMYE